MSPPPSSWRGSSPWGSTCSSTPGSSAATTFLALTVSLYWLLARLDIRGAVRGARMGLVAVLFVAAAVVLQNLP